MLNLLTDTDAWAALVTLTALEIILGIDNIVFISVIVSRCSPRDARRARHIGFSVDSIVTAIGLAKDIEIMIIAVVLAMIVMYAASGPVAHFVAQHPTTKMLALAFLVMIGVALVADGFAFHIPRGYIYSAMVFAGAVEVFNVLVRRNRARNAARTKRQSMRERHQ